MTDDNGGRAAEQLGRLLGVVDEEESKPEGVGSADAGEHGPDPEPVKHAGDAILDFIYGPDHRGGVAWTRRLR